MMPYTSSKYSTIAVQTTESMILERPTLSFEPAVPLQAGQQAVGLDIRMSQSLDILTTKGFVQHLFQTCRLRKGSGLLAAPVCSTFVFMSLTYILQSLFECLGSCPPITTCVLVHDQIQCLGKLFTKSIHSSIVCRTMLYQLLANPGLWACLQNDYLEQNPNLID